MDLGFGSGIGNKKCIAGLARFLISGMETCNWSFGVIRGFNNSIICVSLMSVGSKQMKPVQRKDDRGRIPLKEVSGAVRNYICPCG